MRLEIYVEDKKYQILSKYFALTEETLEGYIDEKINGVLRSLKLIKDELENNPISTKIINDIMDKKHSKLTISKIQKIYNIGFPLSGKIFTYYKLFIENWFCIPIILI